MRPVLLFLILQFSIISLSYAEILISGRVLQNSQKTIAYVNIGIKGKNLGTVSDEHGNFSINIKPENAIDTLTFSCIGFQEISLPIQNIIEEKQTIFYLKEKVWELKEIVVNAKKPKIKNIGTKSTNPLLWGSATSKDGMDIIEMGKLIELKKPSELQKLHVYLKGIYNNSATFRINFYEIKADFPGERIIEKNIIFRKDLIKGWLEIDLTEFELVLENNFIVSIEFLPENERSTYSFSYGGQLGGSTYTRTSSLGKWQKINGATISMYLTVKQ